MVAGGAIALTLGLCGSALTQPPQPDALLDGFRDPPPEALPRVWWHWMNGNITREGIRRDLEWMKRVGIGGIDVIDASIDTPQVVDKRLVYMTPEWKETFRYTAQLADSYGMEISVDSSPGWSETVGPWVTPQGAMKKLVWTATPVTGGMRFRGVLAQPSAIPGPFQNVRKPASNVPDFYRDSIVIAYRDAVAQPATADIASNAGAVDKAALDDGDLTVPVTLTPADAAQEVWVRAAYAQPTQLQGLTLALSTNDDLGFAARVEASDDGMQWRAVADVPKAAQIRRFALLQQTISFAPVTAKFFRLAVRPDQPIPNSLRIVDRAPGLADPPTVPKRDTRRFYNVYELVFRATATVHEFEKKAGFAIARDNYAIAAPNEAAPGTPIAPGSVIDVTRHMHPDGSFDWIAPPGRWTVLRMGYGLTGTQNHPASAEATGLEVDKLNADHVRAYLEHYLATYRDAAGPDLFGKRGLTALMVDSTEVGAQNWTEDILAEFRRLRGYDPLPWLPALTGAMVQSAAGSDKFLWDFRRTINELLAENHYGQIAKMASAQGLFHYMEALEDHRPTFGDDIEMRRFADIPTGAMWTYGSRTGPLKTYLADLRGAASVAHVYGRKLVAAESLTSAGQPWNAAPRDLKPVVDLEFALGVNRVIVHTSVHQPVDRPPGLSLYGYGQFFNRLESWAEQSGAWMRYIARCSWLLQQGRYAADIAYFYGEEAPITGLFGDVPVDIPDGYGMDFVGSHALKNIVSVERGNLVTASGMQYRLLYLGGSSRLMTLPVLLRLRDLVRQGATVVGRRPQGSPSLADDAVLFEHIADELFGKEGGLRPLGSGQVFASGSLQDALTALKLRPDFDYSKSLGDSELLYLHRHLPDGELYFITNRRDRAEVFATSFRVPQGYTARILDAVTGRVTETALTLEEGRSRVSLPLRAYGSAFVLFRKGPAHAQMPKQERVLQTLTGPWQVRFQPGRGAPDAIVLPVLQSWSGHVQNGVKHFSGTANYATTFSLPRWKPGTRLTLDLGDVREIADITLNGKALGTVWTAPFGVDIGKAARFGPNVLEIRVTNLWVNRLIGDAQPGAAHKYTFTTIPTYRADAPLRPSGLLGPVTIRQSGF